MYKILVAFLFLSTAKISAQVTVINSGTSEHLRTIHKAGNSFVISGIGNYLVKCNGECNGLIPLTIPYTTPYPYFYFNLSRPDSNTLYMTAIENLHFMIFKSGDCGLTWSKKLDTLYFPDALGTVFFDSLSGIALCSVFKTLKTSNGFNTFSVNSWPGKDPVFGVTDGDSSVIILSGPIDGEGISISHDRGTTWVPGNLIKGIGGPINDVKFKDTDTVFAVTRYSDVSYDSVFSMSYNRGLTWKNKIFNPNYPIVNPPKHRLLKLCIKSTNEIYVLAQDYQTNAAIIFKTVNQGDTWQRYITPFSTPLNDMVFINDSVALVCGNSGLLFKWNKIQATYTSITESTYGTKSFTVYPNPMQNDLKIAFDRDEMKSESMKYYLYNHLGIPIKTGEIDNSCENIIDFKSISAGLYILRVVTSKEVHSIKVLKN